MLQASGAVGQGDASGWQQAEELWAANNFTSADQMQTPRKLHLSRRSSAANVRSPELLSGRSLNDRLEDCEQKRAVVRSGAGT